MGPAGAGEEGAAFGGATAAIAPDCADGRAAGMGEEGLAAGNAPEEDAGFAMGLGPVEAAGFAIGLDPVEAAGFAPRGADGLAAGIGARGGADCGDAAGRVATPFPAAVPFGGEPAGLPLGAGPGVTVEGSFSEGGIPKLVATFTPRSGCSEIAPTLAGLFGAEKTSALDMAAGRSFGATKALGVR